MNNFLGRTIEGSYIIGSNNIKQQNIPYNQCTLLIMSWVFVFFVLFVCFFLSKETHENIANKQTTIE